jgi:iron complex outermembrane receptor protein
MTNDSQRRAKRALLAGTTLGALMVLAAPGLAMAAAANTNQVTEVVVTAQRRSENIQQVPISIQAFTGQTVKDLGIKPCRQARATSRSSRSAASA